MQAIHRLESLEPIGGVAPAVVVGNFDGVHRGHQALVHTALEEAAALGHGHPLRVVALTFDPHPARVLCPDRAPVSLMSLEEKAEALQQLGVSRLAVLPFSHEVSLWPPEAFARRVLQGALGAGVVVVGRHFRFGHGRAGDLPCLERLGESLGFRVRGLDPVLHEGTAVSSTRVRQALARGAVEGARALLGRRFALAGEVVRGDGRGRKLGIPTANVRVAGETVPGRGVYACWAGVGGVPRPAVVNVGHRPTFAGADISVEAHLLDFDADLYGTRLVLQFEARLREEQAFSGPDALVAQIHSDILEARRILIDPA
jgi:riboflavin kinase/FMN adenylyltransferase